MKRLFRYALMVCVGVSAVLAQAKTMYVSAAGTNDADGDFPDWAGAATNIQDAINKAASATHDVILVTNATYAQSTQISVGGIHNLTIRSYNNGVSDPNNTILRPAPGSIDFPGLYIWNGATNIVIDGFTICNFTNNDFGGGIRIDAASTLVVTNCTLNNNSGLSRGGAISAEGLWAQVWNCRISANMCAGSGGNGGGVYIPTAGMVANCTIISNQTGANGSGGGIYAGASVSISNCAIAMNLAWGGGGGGGIIGGGTIKNCLIANNSATNIVGGAAYGGGLNMSSEGGVAENCTIVSNMSTYSKGAGVCIQAASTFRNCLVASNSPDGIYVLNVTFTALLDSCTIARNNGYGIRGKAPLPLLYVTNCIVAGNINSQGMLYVDTNNVFYSCSPNPILPPGVGNITNEPNYVDPANDFRLAADSPCINKGINEGWMTPAVDLDGRGRIDVFSKQADMGCYEFVRTGSLFTVR